ncbi:MAG TPA: alanine racemase [Acidobacteriaceae bacterium]|nr:alanine racemase [Acidobacteriaceae bacterium]
MDFEIAAARPVWAEISRRKLIKNFHKKLRAAASAYGQLLPVVKANAYGHDVLLCAPLLVNAGAHWLGVTSAAEGLQVRSACPTARVLLMSGIWEGEAEEAIENSLTPVVWEAYHFDLLEEAALRRGMAPASFPVHVEVDTGMSRQGVRVVPGAAGTNDLAALLARFGGRSPLRLEGVTTHFSQAEILSSAGQNLQLQGLAAALDLILAAGHRPMWLHAGNSATVVAGPDREKLAAMAARAGALLMFRPGLALYGYLDRISRDGVPLGDSEIFPETGNLQGFEPVLEWKARVTSLRTIQPGDTVGYDNTFTARRTTRLALLPAGYADGFNRALSNRGHVLLRGERASIAGRVSMDQTIVDVTDVPGVLIGDEAVLIGRQGSRSISAWDIADLTGTIAWEVLCAISARVPRVAVQ